MIASFDCGFIFLKTRKTAGTSVEIGLTPHCGPGDVISRISRPDEEIRFAKYGVGPQNDRLPLRLAARAAPGRWVSGRGWPRAYNHMPSDDVRSLVGADFWASAFKFSIVRNPWDSVLSHYHWRVPDGSRSIDDYLRSDDLKLLTRNEELLFRKGVAELDLYCRFENLKEDLESVSERLGLRGGITLERTKAGTRRDRRHYRDVLSDDQAATIADAFALTVATFGYSYD